MASGVRPFWTVAACVFARSAFFFFAHPRNFISLSFKMLTLPESSAAGTANIFQVTDLSFNPDPPVREQDATITVTGVLSQPMAAGTVSLLVTNVDLDLSVFEETFDLCKLVSCPAPAGPISGSLTIPAVSIPSFAPSGAYTGVGKFKLNSGVQSACVSTTFVL
jgi:hypothetical protein